MDEFEDLGCNAGVNVGNITTRPTFIVNDAVTWVKGTHTLKVGMEWRKIMGNIHANGNEAGTFIFGRGCNGHSWASTRAAPWPASCWGRSTAQTWRIGRCPAAYPAAARLDLARRRYLAASTTS